MRVRPFEERDRAELDRMVDGFPYCDPADSKLECCLVVVDENDRPIAAAGAERRVELHSWFSRETQTLEKVEALRLLHGEMGRELRELGYQCADAFLPPDIAERFGKRLMRTFGWFRNWPSFGVRF